MKYPKVIIELAYTSFVPCYDNFAGYSMNLHLNRMFALLYSSQSKLLSLIKD